MSDGKLTLQELSTALVDYLNGLISSHEAKALKNSHPQAIAGATTKERIERGTGSVSLSGSESRALTIMYSQAFAVLPSFRIWIENASVGPSAFAISRSSFGSTTGASPVLQNGLAQAQTITYGWEAVGKDVN